MKDSASQLDDFQAIPGGGANGALIRSLDWSGSPLGAPHSWPQSLKTALSICLGSKFPMGIWWGKDLVVFYNDAYIPIAGRKHPMFLGRPAQEMWPEIWDVVGTMAKQVVASGEANWAEDQPLFMERRGFVEECYFTFSFSPAREESGAVGGMFYAVQEMTGRVIGERRLGALRELGATEPRGVVEIGEAAADILRKYPNDTPFALFYVTDRNGKTATLVAASGLTAGSVAAPQTCDLDPSATGGWPLARINVDRRSERVDGLRKMFPGQLPPIPYEEKPDSAFLIPIEIRGRDAPTAFLILGINPRLDFDDNYRAFFGLISKQLTSQIFNVLALEEETRRAEALSQLDRSKTAFFSNVSHEFRTPLTLMLGPIEHLLSGGLGALSPEVREEAETVHRNALRLLKLVNALLDFSRIEAGRMEATFAPTDLVAVTIDLASNFRSTIERAGMQLVVEAEPLPAPVYVDVELWEKIVLNLLSNAFKYTSRGTIRVGLKQRGDSVELSVSDTGIGISEAELPKVFQRFHRVAGAEGRTHEGTGIGLALVQELVKLHGGSIRAESSVGKGTAFTVQVPLGSKHLPAHQLAPSGLRERAPRSQPETFAQEVLHLLPSTNAGSPNEPGLSAAGRKRVLFADDNADMREYVRKLLQHRYEVQTVGDGAQALAAMRASKPDLVLSDIMMPGMGGIELLREVRRDPALRVLPMILLSARAGEEAKAGGIEEGADDYLTKPFSAKELQARVQMHLALAEIRQAAAEKDVLVEHLASRQRWIELVLDLVPTPLLLMEPGTARITFANQAAHRMAGGRFPMDVSNVPAEEYALDYSVLDPAGRRLAHDEYPAVRAARGEKITDAEIVWRTPVGNFALLVDSQQVPALDGEPARVVLCLRDITALKRAQGELHESIQARDNFVSIASHELKTPVTSLRLQHEMLARSFRRTQTVDPKRMEKLLSVSERQMERLMRLVEDMLDIARINGGKLELHRTSVTLETLLEEMVERFREMGALSGGPIRLDTEAAGVVGEWDAFRLEQVFVNLLSNAVKYGEGKPVEISARHEGAHAVVRFIDHGIGIAPEHCGRIFERFERAVGHGISGLGLGLFIARNIIEAHGGTIEVASAPSTGSTFTVRLPMAASAGSGRHGDA